MEKIFEKVVTGLQRPIIFVLMLIACPSMFFLGIWACYGLAYPMFTGEMPVKEEANIYLVYGLVMLICVAPFLLSWVSYRLAKKAFNQIKHQGLVYK